VTHVLGKEVKHQLANIIDYAQNINGGWEVWLQVQLYTRLKNENGVLAFTREESYPGGGNRCDFTYVPRNASSTMTWVELKVQRNADVRQPVDDFAKDINKISSGHFNPSDTAGAVVVIPHNAWNALQYLKEQYPSYYPHAGYCLVDGGNISAPAKIGDHPPDQRDVANKVLLLYWAVL
jgi:hypothetical protein